MKTILMAMTIPPTLLLLAFVFYYTVTGIARASELLQCDWLLLLYIPETLLIVWLCASLIEKLENVNITRG